MKHISILGSTGSIGKNALKVVETHREEFNVVALAANSDVDTLEHQIRKFCPRLAALNTPNAAEQLRKRLPDYKSTEILSGSEGIQAVATIPEADQVLDGMGGSAGLLPTLSAINAGKDIAFVNKEVMVMCGSIVMNAVKKNGINLIPIDGEMSAIFQCLEGARERQDDIHRLILTASGGPFRDTPKENLHKVTAQQALKHPNWDMGAKITIDSATMMNKGLEVIEAKWLFDIELEKIDIVIHRESIIHSMVEWMDSSTLAQLGPTDMRIMIQYALSYPNRLPTPVPRLDLCELRTLHFEPVDRDKFPCISLAYTAAEVGGTLPVVLSSADEVVVEAFLNERIGFMDIPAILDQVMNKHVVIDDPTLEDVLEVDRWTKSTTRSIINAKG
ncbi:1-deoxy-D-xylulose-5-phosphate reductoisomerase [Candidatus Poribacteria bacterium]|nr:1-deoxy-D-xylulose-5-phosphate reductoisomerase [Candidatus Poribacteria bacterium]MYB63592.1 1-deoxy-D-xylulose-5-phosphate reductoisomerase [Candidatus Poribacteria bacterium]